MQQGTGQLCSIFLSLVCFDYVVFHVAHCAAFRILAGGVGAAMCVVLLCWAHFVGLIISCILFAWGGLVMSFIHILTHAFQEACVASLFTQHIPGEHSLIALLEYFQIGF